MGSPISVFPGMESEDIGGYEKSNYWGGDGVKLLGGCIPPSPPWFGSHGFYQRQSDADNSIAVGSQARLLPSAESAGISAREHSSIVSHLRIAAAPKKKHAVYSPKDRALVGKYASEFGNSAALKHFKNKLPDLKESTVNLFKKKYQGFLKTSTSGAVAEIGKLKRGRPTTLPRELDVKLMRFINKTREIGGVVNMSTINGMLIGLITATPEKYGFEPTRGWRQSLYRRLSFSIRKSTTSRPPIM